MILRYYADADIREWHDHAVRLLRTLHDEHGVTVELDRIVEQHGTITDFPGDVRSLTPEDVYERDLKRNPDLNQSIDRTPSEAFKRSGNSTSLGTSRSSMTTAPFSGPRRYRATLTAIDRVLRRRLRWTSSKTSPLLQAIGSVSTASRC